jgi:uncharacterized membrane protein
MLALLGKLSIVARNVLPRQPIMSTIVQNPAKSAGEPKATARPGRRASFWRNVFKGMGTVLEIMPEVKRREPSETPDAIEEAWQNVNQSVWAAFEKLAAEYGEIPEMPASPKFSLPSPEVLEKYKQIDPEFPERLLAMAEGDLKAKQDDQRAKREMELESLRSDYAYRRLGQILGFAIGLAAIVAGSVTAVQGAEWAGLAIGGGGVIGLVSVFVIGRRTS